MPSTRVSVRRCGDESVRAGRGSGQLDWYRFARPFVAGRTVLDAGCGLGDGLRILATAAAKAEGQDLDPRLGGPDVLIKPVEEIPDKSYDVVTSIDVIEHVEDPDHYINFLPAHFDKVPGAHAVHFIGSYRFARNIYTRHAADVVRQLLSSEPALSHV
jgi:2-polyprenyl-3-methyl-5-hydroxy-6-metoxy-1,4-benzoquinol methylase